METPRIEDISNRLVSMLFVEGIIEKEQLKTTHFIVSQALTEAYQAGIREIEGADIKKLVKHSNGNWTAYSGTLTERNRKQADGDSILEAIANLATLEKALQDNK